MGTWSHTEEWLFSGGTFNNRWHFAPSIDAETQLLLYGPENSVGLLIAMAEEKLKLFSALLASYQ